MAARDLPHPSPRHPAPGTRDLHDRYVHRDDLVEILREAGLPHGFCVDWLIDRVEPATRGPR
jgi:hypothetical protein